ncbi:hypothetical protein ZOD2009_06264 [Haladaptatus paucihalophilus DX253]|uniref:Uncharacterized protein n=1 Tax=Haladaptatus paucihalophilus DX253 TaxID=797209 RepID=E7QR30_HALPU|nr:MULTISPECIES: hypothetical protein [Haladaptatus]EFW92938.1 hypothetical protein ZOD2009_06264 [Haladaptatus paucihalophilus DX253]GKZ15826.1 hypothetical protein HAL_37070 [Haladaptatus sp. T7]SHL18719.1 hypothetical protein SAMN05444342_3182 [Haladaptatus paucihalophilus DX253]
MQAIEITYIVLSVVLAATGLTMVGLAMRAYQQTSRRSMLVLSIGFSILVAAAIATTFSAFLTDFNNSRLLLTVNYGVSTVGYLFVIYSVTGAD